MKYLVPNRYCIDRSTPRAEVNSAKGTNSRPVQYKNPKPFEGVINYCVFWLEKAALEKKEFSF